MDENWTLNRLLDKIFSLVLTLSNQNGYFMICMIFMARNYKHPLHCRHGNNGKTTQNLSFLFSLLSISPVGLVTIANSLTGLSQITSIEYMMVHRLNLVNTAILKTRTDWGSGLFWKEKIAMETS